MKRLETEWTTSVKGKYAKPCATYESYASRQDAVAGADRYTRAVPVECQKCRKWHLDLGNGLLALQLGGVRE